MNIVKFHHYKVVGLKDKAVTILEEDVGWLHLDGKLGVYYGRDNIFGSVEEIEMIIGQKLEHVWSMNDKGERIK